jgi:hypothetical protein
VVPREAKTMICILLWTRSILLGVFHEDYLPYLQLIAFSPDDHLTVGGTFSCKSFNSIQNSLRSRR